MNIDKYKPGVHKLILHLDHLRKMRDSLPVAPIHISVWPTIRCQLKCSYCCCRKEDRTEPELSLEAFQKATDVLVKYGTKAMEFSGGGEPTLWTYFDEGVAYAHSKGLRLSLITNGLTLNKLSKKTLKMFDWIRISLQSGSHARQVLSGFSLPETSVTASFIVAYNLPLRKLEEIKEFAEDKNVIIRVAVQRPSTVERTEQVKQFVEKLGSPLFFSNKESGKPKGCFMPYIRAAINWRGEFLPCPSTQLNIESEGKIEEDFYLCTINVLEDWLLNNPPHDLGFQCSFCNCGKEHNDLIYDLRNGVEDADFV